MQDTLQNLLLQNLLLEENKPSVFNKLLQPALEKVIEQGKQLPRHHNQTFDYVAFFRLLIFYFTSDIKSLRLLINTFLNKGLLPPALNLCSVPYTTFGEAFERFSVSLFIDVFEHLLTTLKFKCIPELDTLGKLYCIDGSLFPVIKNMLWAKYTEKHQALKLHLCLDLNHMLPVNFIIGPGNSSERQALRDMLEAGITYIADRGYMCFKLFDEIQEALSFFVFRVKNNLVYEVSESLIVTLPLTVQHLFSNVTDEKVQCTNDKSQNIYRLVRFQIGSELYCLLTNRFDLTTFQIICIYAYRWQIELLFRFLKRTMNGIHLIKNDHRGVTIQFYALLITAILLLHLKQDILEEIENRETQNETPVNASIPLIKIEEIEKNQETPHAELETLNLEASHIEETEKNQTHVELETLNLETSHIEETEKNQTHVELETLNLETSHIEETKKNQTHVELETLNLETSHIEEEETEKNQTHAELETSNLEASHYEEIPSAYHFLNVLGKKAKKYWKISIHWLEALRRLLADPFDGRAIEILGKL